MPCKAFSWLLSKRLSYYACFSRPFVGHSKSLFTEFGCRFGPSFISLEFVMSTRDTLSQDPTHLFEDWPSPHSRSLHASLYVLKTQTQQSVQNHTGAAQSHGLKVQWHDGELITPSRCSTRWCSSEIPRKTPGQIQQKSPAVMFGHERSVWGLITLIGGVGQCVDICNS